MVLVSSGFVSAILDSVLDPGIYMWIDWVHLVAVFSAAAGAFCSAQMTLLDLLRHVLALSRSSRLPQALFSFWQNDVPGFL